MAHARNNSRRPPTHQQQNPDEEEWVSALGPGWKLTSGPPPTDPYIHHVFPNNLQNFSTGRWALK
ncbi:hypothetical protein BDV12DRAFT_173218 [Aspergillus spectabilis]